MSHFDNMTSEMHIRGIKIILDLPLYPYVKNLKDQFGKHNTSEREESITTGPLANYRETRDTLTTAPSVYHSHVEPVMAIPLDDHVATIAIRYWLEKGVDGFYLKGLENYVNDTNFMPALRHWKNILGTERILMCSEKALEEALDGEARNVILNRIDLIDVFLDVSNGSKSIKSQVSQRIKGILFKKSGYPWIHWSTGSVDKPRLASSLQAPNASVAIAILGMMLPGTPNIFYGDEVRTIGFV